MPYKPGCGHRWTAIGDPSSHQLRCDWCGAMGYTRAGAPGARKAHERIYVYICEVQGCHRSAMAIDGKKRVCAGHKKTRTR